MNKTIRKNSCKRKYSDEWAATEALKYSSRQEFRKNCLALYMYAYRNKILNQICSHMPRPRRLHRKYTIESVLELSLNYNSKAEFRKKEKGAYNYCYVNKLMDIVCYKMKVVVKWTHKSAAEEAAKYKHRADFKNKSAGAYRYCTRNKILDDVCGHMK